MQVRLDRAVLLLLHNLVHTPLRLIYSSELSISSEKLRASRLR